MPLKTLIAAEAARIEDIAAHLDALSAEERVAQVAALGRGPQRRLWDLAGRASPITLDHFVPPSLPALSEVVHHGRNTLPVFTRFQKRFCRPATRDDARYGYNEGLTRPLIGPGYFVARSTAGDASWEALGAVVIDYFVVPDDAVVDGWPKVVPNSRGIQRFVYDKTRDFMRRVSEHVSIGAAYKGERPIGAFFVLCREDVEHG